GTPGRRPRLFPRRPPDAVHPARAATLDRRRHLGRGPQCTRRRRAARHERRRRARGIASRLETPGLGLSAGTSMKTDQLISSLVADRTPPKPFGRRLTLSLLAGALISLGLFVVILGPRH